MELTLNPWNERNQGEDAARRGPQHHEGVLCPMSFSVSCDYLLYNGHDEGWM